MKRKIKYIEDIEWRWMGEGVQGCRTNRPGHDKRRVQGFPLVKDLKWIISQRNFVQSCYS